MLIHIDTYILLYYYHIYFHTIKNITTRTAKQKERHETLDNDHLHPLNILLG